MDSYDHLFKLLLIGDAGVGKSRCAGTLSMGWRLVTATAAACAYELT